MNIEEKDTIISTMYARLGQSVDLRRKVQDMMITFPQDYKKLSGAIQDKLQSNLKFRGKRHQMFAMQKQSYKLMELMRQIQKGIIDFRALADVAYGRDPMVQQLTDELTSTDDAITANKISLEECVDILKTQEEKVKNYGQDIKEEIDSFIKIMTTFADINDEFLRITDSPFDDNTLFKTVN